MKRTFGLVILALFWAGFFFLFGAAFFEPVKAQHDPIRCGCCDP